MKTVMVVDDSRFMQDEVAHILSDSAYTLCVACRDAEEAIRAYHEHRPDFVLMDVVLPGIDGFEATTAIRQKWPSARVVVMSSLAYDETQHSARAAGAVGCLFKPFTAADLLAVLAGAEADAE